MQRLKHEQKIHSRHIFSFPEPTHALKRPPWWHIPCKYRIHCSICKRFLVPHSVVRSHPICSTYIWKAYFTFIVPSEFAFLFSQFLYVTHWTLSMTDRIWSTNPCFACHIARLSRNHTRAILYLKVVHFCKPHILTSNRSFNTHAMVSKMLFISFYVDFIYTCPMTGQKSWPKMFSASTLLCTTLRKINQHLLDIL